MLRRDAEVSGSILVADLVHEIHCDSVQQDGYVYLAETYEGPDGERILVADAYLHDPRILPHLIPGEIETLFPRAVAAVCPPR